MKFISKYRSLFICYLLTALVTASCAVYPDTYDDWNYDDGLYLDEDEFSDGLDGMAYYDTWNYDGEDYITENEWNEGIDDFFGAYRSVDFGTFAEWDIDGNGLLSDDEFKEGVFKTVDLNDDEQIDDDEFETWQKQTS